MSDIGSIPARERGQVCQSVQDGGQSLNSPGLRDQYPRDIIKPAGLKNDVNSVRSVERDFQKFYALERFSNDYRKQSHDRFAFGLGGFLIGTEKWCVITLPVIIRKKARY